MISRVALFLTAGRYPLRASDFGLLSGFGNSDFGIQAYGTARMRQKLLVVVTGGLVKVITPLMLMVFVR